MGKPRLNAVNLGEIFTKKAGDSIDRPGVHLDVVPSNEAPQATLQEAEAVHADQAGALDENETPQPVPVSAPVVPRRSPGSSTRESAGPADGRRSDASRLHAMEGGGKPSAPVSSPAVGILSTEKLSAQITTEVMLAILQYQAGLRRGGARRGQTKLGQVVETLLRRALELPELPEEPLEQ